MNRRKLSHVIAAGLLAGLLGLPGTALAAGPRTHSPARTWRSIADWQYQLVAYLLTGGMLQKEGYGIDPNGGKPAGSGGTTSTTSGAATGQGTAGSGQ